MKKLISRIIFLLLVILGIHGIFGNQGYETNGPKDFEAKIKGTGIYKFKMTEMYTLVECNSACVTPRDLLN